MQLVSAGLLAIEIVLVKQAVARVEPTRMVVWQMLATGVCFVTYSLVAEHLWGVQASPLCWGAAIYQGIFIGAIGFIVWTWQMQRFSASVLAIFGFLSPADGSDYQRSGAARAGDGGVARERGLGGARGGGVQCVVTARRRVATASRRWVEESKRRNGLLTLTASYTAPVRRGLGRR